MSLSESLISFEGSKKRASQHSKSLKITKGSSSDSRVSKQTVFELKSMPEIVYEEFTDTLVQPIPVKSTEEICFGSDCYTFKTLVDPGLAEAYYVGEVYPQKKERDHDIYINLAKAAKLAPVKRIVDSLSKSSIDLQYYGLVAEQIKPLSEAMMNNTSVTQINLAGNILSLDATYHIGQMLRKNKFLQNLNLQHCMIGPEGAEMLGNGLEICEHLVDLDLSYNGLGDKGMELIAIKLGYNISIKNLNLSHNNLTHKSGFSLAETMEENITLQNLNLSWNRLAEEPGLKQFLTTAAERNESLLRLDLSWNTLSGIKIANVVKNFISEHKTLQELNISFNRFESAAENIALAKGVNNSESLKILNMAYNGITADTAFALISNLNKRTALRKLHLDNVWVKPEFEKLRRELKAQGGIEVVIDGVMGGVDIKGPDMQALLLKRANFLGNKPKKNKKDFGWFLLRLQQAGTLTSVTKAKFETFLKEDNIKLDDGMVDEFVKRFKDDKKKVDLNLMLEKYLKLFPNTVLPVPKQKKKPTDAKVKEGKSSKSPKKDENKLDATLTNQETLPSTLDNLVGENIVPKRESLKSNEIPTDNVNEITYNENSPDAEAPKPNETETFDADQKSIIEGSQQGTLIHDEDKSQEKQIIIQKEENLTSTTEMVDKSAKEIKLDETTTLPPD